MLMVRFILSASTEGCSAMHVYCPSSIALIFLSVSVEEGRIQSSPWERKIETYKNKQKAGQTILAGLFAARRESTNKCYKWKKWAEEGWRIDDARSRRIEKERRRDGDMERWSVSDRREECKRGKEKKVVESVVLPDLCTTSERGTKRERDRNTKGRKRERDWQRQWSTDGQLPVPGPQRSIHKVPNKVYSPER